MKATLKKERAVTSKSNRGGPPSQGKKARNKFLWGGKTRSPKNGCDSLKRTRMKGGIKERDGDGNANAEKTPRKGGGNFVLKLWREAFVSGVLTIGKGKGSGNRLRIREGKRGSGIKWGGVAREFEEEINGSQTKNLKRK